MNKGDRLYTNRLINEKSPYLLQHAHNPVDWYPWCPEAFEKARREDKPIFLSIGYSTCHWCHVMAEESFSDPEIASLLNRYFVSIKVDREERPDVDNIYMKAVVMLTGSGGWPLTLFLTPDKKPFYGGTYFPPEDRFGRPGLKRLLLLIAEMWSKKRDEILKTAESVTKGLKQMIAVDAGEASIFSEEILERAYKEFLQSFDPEYGGFGKAPKFPMGHLLSFLLRYWKRKGEKNALWMVEKHLLAMSTGGIHDQIGGGFHRYSTDREWMLPHFEKMLYDQALISMAYLEAYQATGKKEYADVAKGIFEYVLREMRDPDGGFLSAQDADSLPQEGSKEKKEGAFYLWEMDEIRMILDHDEAEIFNYFFGVQEDGNIRHDPMGEFKKKNILHVAHSVSETARRFNKTPDEIEEILERAKIKLFHARYRRPPPFVDDKILVDWNGLMISALSFGSLVLRERRYSDAAERSAQFILNRLMDKDGRLLHLYREGESKVEAHLDDYAFFINGLVELYQASFNLYYLIHAHELAKRMLELFWDNEEGGFFFSPSSHSELILNSKEIYDGAVPSGNSFAALCLIKLARLTGDREFENKVQALFRAFSGQISKMPSAYPQMLIALDFVLGPSLEVVIAEGEDKEGLGRMLNVVYKDFVPNKVTILVPWDRIKARELMKLISFVRDKRPLDGITVAYVCSDYTCRQPTSSVEELQKLLKEPSKM